MKAKPYIGITGPTTVGEVNSINREFASAGYSMHSRHIPMIGFLVSLKTLGGQPTQNRRYPRITDLRNLVKSTDGKSFTTIHYNSNDQTTLAKQLEEIFYELYPDNLCRAVQLNIVYPNKEEIEKAKREMPDLKIIFQASHRIIEGKAPNEVAENIRRYGSLIDYVLIDPSGGKGREFDIEPSVNLYEELRSVLPKVTIGLAGGFTGDNVATRARDLIAKIGNSDFSIDAEGGLRDKVTDAYGDDLFNRSKVGRYIKAAASVLS